MVKFKTVRGNRSKWIIGLVVFVVLAVVIVVPGSRAKYQVSGSIDIVDGEVSYSFADLNVLAMYVGGDVVSSLDDSTYYTLDTSSSYCTVDGEVDGNITLSWDTSTSTLSVSPMLDKGTKCYLYFNIASEITASDIIAGHNLDTRDDFSTVLTTDTTETLYYVEDEMYGGYSYYYAGAVSDNYVKFAGYYWRIVRFNGDGSVRLIYQGATADATGDDATIGTSAYNSSKDAAEYVGFTYTSGSQWPSLQSEGTDSTIKAYLEDWYDENLSSYSSYLDTGGMFCNDRTSYSDTSGSTTGWSSSGTTYYYEAFIRLSSTSSNYTPMLGCSNTSDVYSTTIGLITADEVSFAGGVWATANSDYYLYTGKYYWTMSPLMYYTTSQSAAVFYVYSNGSNSSNVLAYGVSSEIGVRPVINLSSSVTFTEGTDGTSSNPYTVVGAE